MQRDEHRERTYCQHTIREATPRVWLIALGLSAAGCVDLFAEDLPPPRELDAGPADTRPPDAAPPDAAPPEPDASPAPDAGCVGAPCRADRDGDGVLDALDLCPFDPDPVQSDIDGDGQGDACDTDADGDGLDGDAEARAGTDPLAADTDRDGLADGVELSRGLDPLSGDTDGDTLRDGDDPCPTRPARPDPDLDGDGLGDGCDEDDDGDGVPDWLDLCPRSIDPDQRDDDGDGRGDACVGDADGDGIADGDDACPVRADPDRAARPCVGLPSLGWTRSVNDLEPYGDGAIAATDGGPLRIEADGAARRWTLADGLTRPGLTTAAVDAAGRMWFGGAHGLAVVREDGWVFEVSAPAGVGPVVELEALDDGLLVAGSGGLAWLGPDGWVEVERAVLPPGAVSGIAVDEDGAVWVAAGGELAVFDGMPSMASRLPFDVPDWLGPPTAVVAVGGADGYGVFVSGAAGALHATREGVGFEYPGWDLRDALRAEGEYIYATARGLRRLGQDAGGMLAPSLDARPARAVLPWGEHVLVASDEGLSIVDGIDGSWSTDDLGIDGVHVAGHSGGHIWLGHPNGSGHLAGFPERRFTVDGFGSITSMAHFDAQGPLLAVTADSHLFTLAGSGADDGWAVIRGLFECPLRDLTVAAGAFWSPSPCGISRFLPHGEVTVFWSEDTPGLDSDDFRSLAATDTHVWFVGPDAVAAYDIAAERFVEALPLPVEPGHQVLAHDGRIYVRQGDAVGVWWRDGAGRVQTRHIRPEAELGTPPVLIGMGMHRDELWLAAHIEPREALPGGLFIRRSPDPDLPLVGDAVRLGGEGWTPSLAGTDAVSLRSMGGDLYIGQCCEHAGPALTVLTGRGRRTPMAADTVRATRASARLGTGVDGYPMIAGAQGPRPVADHWRSGRLVSVESIDPPAPLTDCAIRPGSLGRTVWCAAGAHGYARRAVDQWTVHARRDDPALWPITAFEHVALTFDGTPWLGTDAGLLRLDLDGAPLPPDDELPEALASAAITALATDRAGHLAVATADILALGPNAWAVRPQPGVTAVAVSDATVWFGTPRGAFRLPVDRFDDPGATAPVAHVAAAPDRRVVDLAADHRGGVAVATAIEVSTYDAASGALRRSWSLLELGGRVRQLAPSPSGALAVLTDAGLVVLPDAFTPMDAQR